MLILSEIAVRLFTYTITHYTIMFEKTSDFDLMMVPDEKSEDHLRK